jgi:hypothetical protein
MTPPIVTETFIHPDDFQKLQELFLGEDLPWYYMDNIDYLDDEDKFQFTHLFYDLEKGDKELTDRSRVFSFIFDELKAKKLYRIKANLVPRTSEIEVGRFHTDIPHKNLEGEWTTGILYMNTNNGYTEFEDGTIVKTEANRFVCFPATMKHRGTSCTDKKARVVINFNFQNMTKKQMERRYGSNSN